MARYALVVGISEYKHLPSPLSKTLGDAEAVANLLRSHGDFQEVILLNKPKLIKADFFTQLNRLLLEQATGSEVLIYYTGHGVLVDDCGLIQGYLATSDCKATKESVTDGIPFAALNSLIGRSPLSSLVMFLDCCHGGALLQAIAESFTAFNKTDKDYLLISACRDFEQAAAMKKEAHSIFTGALLEALSEERQDDQGKINSGSLFGFIYGRLKQKQQEPRQLGYGRAMEIVNYRQVVSQKVIDETCPYVGLNAFDESTAQWFFGREMAFNRLMSKIEQSPFVFVVGVSGSGKSSLVKAKLIPEMKRRGHRILLMKPWSNPIQTLKNVFAEILEETGTDVNDFEEQIDAEGLLAAIADLPKPILLVIGQFEEVFTVCSQVSERRKFIQMLVDVAQTQTADFVVVATMRIDFLVDCTYANLDAIVNEQMVVISGMNDQELRDVIAKPAEAQGYQLSDGLLDAILQDIDTEQNCLPLLEFALQELWENRESQKRLLTFDGYRQMDRLKGALNRHAERLYEQQSASGKEWMRRIFLKLVRTGNDAKDTRQRERRQVILDLAGDDRNARKEIERILKSLEGKNGRLLVASEENQVAIVDLAHEALMVGWQRFAEWRLEDRDLRRLGDRVMDSCKEWQEKGKSEDYLLPNGLMLEVREQLSSMKVLLSAAAWNYYQESERNATDKVAFIERNLTEIKLREEAIRILNLPPVRSVSASVQTIKNTGTSLEKLDRQVLAPIQSLLRSNVELAREVQCWLGHENGVRSVAFSPDGKQIVSGSDDKTIRLWDLDGNQIGQPFQGHGNWVWSVAFSPDGKQIVSGSVDQTIRLWDLDGNQIGQPFQGHESWVRSVAFSPDGKQIVSGSDDKTIRLWDLDGNQIGQPFQGHENQVWSVAFSPDGKQIVSGSDDQTIRLWDLDGNQIGQPFQGHENQVWSVAFSPDGKQIVSGSADQTIRLWDLDGNQIGQPFQGHENWVWSVAFSPDGKQIVSGSDDKTIRLWDLDGNQIGQPFQGHESWVWSVAFSPDGKQIVSGSDDKTIRLWDLDGNQIGQPFQGHEAMVWSVAFSPDVKQIVSGSGDKTIRLWDLDGNQIGQPFQGHESWVMSVAFSPDGKQIVSGSSDKTIRLWDLDGNQIGQPFQGHENVVRSVAFSPDGKQIVSGSDDKTIRLWDLDGNQIGQPFQGHEDRVMSVAFSPDVKQIVSGSDDQTIRLWDLDGNQIGQPFQGHENGVMSVAFSPDVKQIVSGSYDKTIRLWDLDGNQIGQPFQGHENWVWSVAFSPDGKQIVSGSNDKTIRLWDLDGNQIGQPFQGHENQVWSVAFSPDGKQIVSGSGDKTIRLWRGGDWQDWLEICCNRLRYHSVFKNPSDDLAREACEVCRKYVWDKEKVER